MEKKEIKRVLEKIYRFLKDNKGRFYVDDCETVTLYEGMSEIIEQELDKAREEGVRETLEEVLGEMRDIEYSRSKGLRSVVDTEEVYRRVESRMIKLDKNNRVYGEERKSQSGEREELLKNKIENIIVDIFHESRDLFFDPNELSAEDFLMQIVNKFRPEILELLSESKKEGYQNGCKDMLEDTKAKIVTFIESESGKSGRKEIIEFIKSLK